MTWNQAIANPLAAPADMIRQMFNATGGMRRPTPGMLQRSHALDSAPIEGRSTKSTPVVQSVHPEVSALAVRLVQDEENEEDRVRALYRHVANGRGIGAVLGLEADQPAKATRRLPDLNTQPDAGGLIVSWQAVIICQHLIACRRTLIMCRRGQ